ncbi:MAG: magnesium transporter CorA family protein [Proteobacteria bacterium]|nr:magnesium transporter CorA family protein [Pseudomonadota bacterium]
MTETSVRPIRVFHLRPGTGVQELDQLPNAPAGASPTQGFYWIACTRAAFGDELARLQAALQALTGQQLVDLHVSDLLNAQLPSHYDYTAQYDLLVVRRLAQAQAQAQAAAPLAGNSRGGPPVLRRIDTSPVGFAVFDQVLLSVHPEDCGVRDAYAARLLVPMAGNRMPASPADLMLRVVNHIVDNYLDLRRELSRQLDHWQTELLRPRTRFANWGALLDARLTLHQLDEICEDQRTAVRAWLDALEGWATPEGDAALRELDLLKVRSRDVLEHIERVVNHVRRLEHSTETAVQMHFSVQSNRTNDIMRILTVITAIFLPLNLIAGIFGMNFEFIPLVHQQDGFWWAMGAMGGITTTLVALFWRKRYLARTGQG